MWLFKPLRYSLPQSWDGLTCLNSFAWKNRCRRRRGGSFWRFLWFFNFRSFLSRLLSCCSWFRSFSLFGLLFFLCWRLFRHWTSWLRSIAINSKKRLSNCQSFSLFDKKLSQESCSWTFDFYSNFISLDISNGFIKLDPFSFLFGELGNSSLSDWVSDLR